MANFDGYDVILDSREIIERIEELKSDFIDATDTDPDDYATLSEDDWALGLGGDGAAEMVALLTLRDDAESLADWHHGETLIHEDYFADALQNLCEDAGFIPAGLPGWIKSNIDWDGVADDMRSDYTDFEFRGSTYWARS